MPPRPEKDRTRFRAATRDDLPAILALMAGDELSRSRPGFVAGLTPGSVAAFEEIEADPHNELWVGELDGEVIASLQLTVIPGLSRGGMKRALVEAVHVRAGLRGRGVGQRMMEEVMAHARTLGCRLMQLTSDTRRTDAHRFYARLGFEPSHVGMKKLL